MLPVFWGRLFFQRLGEAMEKAALQRQLLLHLFRAYALEGAPFQGVQRIQDGAGIGLPLRRQANALAAPVCG